MGSGIVGCGIGGWMVGFLLATAVAWLVTRLLVPVLRRRNVLDIPDNRSSHTVPTPRGGGLGIVAGFAVAMILFATVCGFRVGWTFWFGLALVASVGLVDDLVRGLPVWVRLGVQIVAAALVVGSTGGLARFPLPAPADFALGWVGGVLSVLWIVGVTNVYNFLDGIDGYAAVQGVVAGLGLAALGGGGIISALGLVAAGACIGFLPHNWHPAKVFMGDVGSSFLGFLFAAMPFLVAGGERPRVVYAAGLLLWFFLADGTFTLIGRAFRRERVWQPHRSHLYQRLVQTGLRHDQVALVVACGMVVVGGMAVAAVRTGSDQTLWLALGVAMVLFLGLLGWARSRESRG